ncbi:MAG TPA: hypothetical protein VMC79_13210 [Rectinemataceae bacterium]|nr:hypothetical protein [Rectinemataceae bacterium]
MLLGELLVSKGLLSAQQLEKALSEQKQSGGEKLGEIVVRLGYVTKEQIDAAL